MNDSCVCPNCDGSRVINPFEQDPQKLIDCRVCDATGQVEIDDDGNYTDKHVITALKAIQQLEDDEARAEDYTEERDCGLC